MIEVGAARHALQARRRRDHPLQRRARHLRLPAAHLGLRPARLDRLVRRGGRGRRLADHARAPRLRPQPVGDRRAAAARARPPITCGAAASASSASRCRASSARALNVLGFGGGVSELFLMLAHARGPSRHLLLGQPGAPQAPREAGHREHRPEGSSTASRARDDVKAFTKEVKQLTGGEGMHIVCDMLRGPVFEAGLAARRAHGRERQRRLAARHEDRLQLGRRSRSSRSPSTTPTTRRSTARGAATELYGRVFKPTIHREIYAFEDLPRVMAEMHAERPDGHPDRAGRRRRCRSR